MAQGLILSVKIYVGKGHTASAGALLALNSECYGFLYKHVLWSLGVSAGVGLGTLEGRPRVGLLGDVRSASRQASGGRYGSALPTGPACPGHKGGTGVFPK